MTLAVSVSLPHSLEIPALTRPWELSLAGRDLARVVRLADELGYESVLVPEHYVIPREHTELSGKFYLHAATAQAFIAGATERIRVNTSLTILPLVHPIVTAKAVATLDFLSGGRAAITFGVGWLEGEFDALGVPFHERGKIADEYLAAIIELLRRDEPSFDGRYVSFRDIAFEPKPVQPHLPIWLGGDADAALRRAARFADGWAPFVTDPEDIPDRLDFIRSQPEYDGRAFAVSYALSNLRIREAHVPQDDPRAELPPGADEIVDRFGWLASLGVTHTNIVRPPVEDFEAYLDHLRWIAAEVLPRLD